MLFVMDIKDAVPHHNLGADDNGVYTKHLSPCGKVHANFRDDGTVEKLEAITSDKSDSSHDVYNMRQQYSWHYTTKEFSGVITKVEVNSSLAKYAIVQYKAPANANNLSAKAHRNSKRKAEAYYRTKPSVIGQSE